MMKLGSKGFTLIELLVAMAFFTFLLLLVTLGFVQINRTYTRGVTVKTIQETTRNVVEDITRTLRTTDDYALTTGPNDGRHLCLSGVRYIWNQHIDQGSPVDNETYVPSTEAFADDPAELITMIKTTDGEACAAPVLKADAEIILDERAAIQDLTITNVGLNSYKLSLVMTTRDAVDEDLAIFGREAVCRIQVSDQYCDVTKFDTVVQTRN